MRRAPFAFLALLLAVPSVFAADAADGSATTTCVPTLIAATCSFSQTVSLSAACEATCDFHIVVTRTAHDDAPVKDLTTQINWGHVAIQTDGCTSIGVGDGTCTSNLRFPLFTEGGDGCIRVTVKSSYNPIPFDGVSVTNVFRACRLADATWTVSLVS